MKKVAKHFPHYFSLVGLMFAGFVGILYFSYDKSFQTAIAVSTALSYLAWGIIHHIIHKDLYFTVILEYLAIACLGLVIILSLIYG